MTEALESRTTALVVPRMPHPPPLVAQRPMHPGEIPPAAMRFMKAAMASEWHVAGFYALGWGVDTGGRLTGRLRASVLLRMRRGQERASALWATHWPIPPGTPIPEPPERELTQAEKLTLLRSPEAFARLTAHERAERVAPAEVVVKWAYELGVYWVRPAPPLGAIGRGAKSGWWSATELRKAIIR